MKWSFRGETMSWTIQKRRQGWHRSITVFGRYDEDGLGWFEAFVRGDVDGVGDCMKTARFRSLGAAQRWAEKTMEAKWVVDTT